MLLVLIALLTQTLHLPCPARCIIQLGIPKSQYLNNSWSFWFSQLSHPPLSRSQEASQLTLCQQTLQFVSFAGKSWALYDEQISSFVLRKSLCSDYPLVIQFSIRINLHSSVPRGILTFSKRKWYRISSRILSTTPYFYLFASQEFDHREMTPIHQRKAEER